MTSNVILEFRAILSGWSSLDTWIVITAALAAMACALPGVYLVLRRQSMMGDAISHTVLLGVVLAFLAGQALVQAGWIDSALPTRHAVMFVGAVFIGVLTAVLTEWVQRLGRVESSAAMGVVFTTMFALGLVLIRMVADDVHIDPDCVLYGIIETVAMQPLGEARLPAPVVEVFQALGLFAAGERDPGLVPRAAAVNAGMLLANVLLLLAFYKELRISAFDPELATSQGVNARWVNYALMAVTAATLVAAFESVGSILVIAMLIGPPATARLLTDRLGLMLLWSVLIAAACAVAGHVLAITVPPIIFGRLGYNSNDFDVKTAGMIAAACGLFFVAAVLFAPRYGLISKTVHNARLSWRIVCEDLLGLLYRFEESAAGAKPRDAIRLSARLVGLGPLSVRLALWRLRWTGAVRREPAGYRLTESGRTEARSLVRAHRLWESYMSRHFALPDDHLHETAARVEHYIDPELERELAEELQAPAVDPHGKAIPAQKSPQ